MITAIRAKIAKAMFDLGNRLVPGRVQAADTWLETLQPSQIRSLLNLADAGDFSSADELYSKMQNTWPMLAKCLFELRSAAAAAPYTVLPYRVGNKAPSPSAIARADLVRDLLTDSSPQPGTDETGIEGARFDLTNALILGASVVEILWHRRSDGVIAPRAFAHVPSRQLAYNPQGVLSYQSGPVHGQLYGRTSATGLQAFAPNRFLVGRWRSRSGALTQGSLVRPLTWWWGCIMFGREWLLSYTERFGSPFRLAHYAPDISEADKATLDEMLAQAGHAGWASLPAGNTLELIEAKNAGTAPHNELLDLADRYCALLVLGQTLTSTTPESGGGTRAQGQVHEGVRRERLEGVARWVGDVLSYQICPAICRLNFGDDDECPVIVPEFSVPEDPAAKAARLEVVGRILPLPKAWTYEQLGVPMPEKDEDVLGGSNQPDVATALRRRDSQTPRLSGAATDAAEDEEHALQSKSSLQSLASGLQSDLQPIRRRLEKVVAQSEPEDAKQELRELLADLPQLFRRMNAAPETATEIEQAIVAALSEGIAAKRQPHHVDGLLAFNENHDDAGRFSESDGGGGTGGHEDGGSDAPEDARIAEMHDAAIGSNNKEHLNFGVIDTRAATRLAKDGGPDLQGYTHRLESDAIRHIINEHGDASKATAKGEYPVTRQNIARIPHYIRTADSVKEEGGSLVWQKRINGKVVIIEEIREPHRRLAVKTMKIKRAKE